MTAEDVVASYNHHRGENSKSAAKVYLQVFGDIKATDKYEVTFTLPSGNADVPYILADYHLLIMPADAAPNSAIGTGAFIKEAFEPGVRYLGKRNPNYWKQGRGWADSVEQLAINDQAARTNSLQTGSVHFINRLDPKTVGLLKRVKGVQIVDVPSAGHYAFIMRCDTPPFDNPDLRMALKLGIDRDDMVKRLLPGSARSATTSRWPPSTRSTPRTSRSAPSTPTRPSPTSRSRGSAGRSRSRSPTPPSRARSMPPRSTPSTRQGGHPARRQARAERRLLGQCLDEGAVLRHLLGGRPTADLMLSVAYQSTAAWNETYWKRPDFDKLLIAARAELNSAKRKQMYREMELMIRDDGGAVIPMFNNFIFGQRDNVAGMVKAPVLTGLRCAEQLYFT